MAQGAVGNDDLALWWSQWLLQVQSTFIFKKISEVEVIYIEYDIYCHLLFGVTHSYIFLLLM